MDNVGLIKIFIDRTTEQIRRSQESGPTNIREEFAFLNVRTSLNYHLRAGNIDNLPALYKEQVESVVANFGRKQASLFYNMVDFHVTENLFLWAISLFDYAKYSENWNLIKDVYEVLKQVLDFYSGTESLYIRPGRKGTILCRMKDEFPFVKENSLICSSHLNILWLRFLDNMKFLAEKFLDIKTDSRVGDLLGVLESAFYPMFWDEGQGNIRFAAEENGISDNGTSLSLYLFRLRLENLLYKQRKKALITLMEREYYSDKGMILSYKARDVLMPELLPVFWSSILRFNDYSRKSQEKVLGLMEKHVSSIHIETYEISNWKYNYFMLEFLCTEKLTFPESILKL